MKCRKVFSFLLAASLALGGSAAVSAEEREIGGVVKADIGFVGGDFENVTKSNGEYIAPDMRAYTTYGTSHTINGLATTTSGAGKLPIVVENGNKVFKLQPTSLSNAVSGKSLNNAFGFRLVKLDDYGKIQDITGDVTISFRMKVTDPACLDKVLFAVRPSHTDCGQLQATSGKIGGTSITGSELTSISRYFTEDEWVDVELVFSKSTFYDKEDFAAHTWGGSHTSGSTTHTVSEEKAIRTPVFYVRPYFNYGTTSKDLEKYSIYLDDFKIDAPTSAKTTVTELVTDLSAEKGWSRGTLAQASVISEVTKDGASAWQIDPAIDVSISGFESTNADRWSRAGQRACIQTSIKDITFDTDSWYKITAYVKTKDGVSANDALGTEADSTKTWVGKPLLGIKLTGNGDQSYESSSVKAYYKNITVSESAKDGWQKMELCFMPKYSSGYSELQLNATAGMAEKFVGEYGNMVLPTYWIRKDIKLEKVDTTNIAQGENIAETAAPFYLEMSSLNTKGWFYADNGTYTAYPKQAGRAIDLMSWETMTFNMSKPLDSSKNYRISFKIKTDSEKFTKAKVNFVTDSTNATLTKEIPAKAISEATEMVFDTRYITQRNLVTDEAPLSAIGDIKAIGIAVDAGAVIRDGATAESVSYTISDLKIERIESILDYKITVSDKTATLTVSNDTKAAWEFKGMLFVSEYDKDGMLVQLASNEDVTLYIGENDTVTEKVSFEKGLTAGNTVKAFLWNQNTLSPIIETVVIK